MAKPKPCINSNCNNLVKNHKATQCRECYIRNRPLPKGTFKKGQISDDKHPRWKGGKWLYWRKKALIRDNYICQCNKDCPWHINGKLCGLYNKDIMDVDHILSKKLRPDLILVLSNLITLCPNCHKVKSNLESGLTKSHSKKLLI